MAREFSLFPPPGVQYSFIKPRPSRFRAIRSPIKGFLQRYDAEPGGLVEAVLSPVYTDSRWLYSVANLQEAMAFNLFGCPVPRAARVSYIKNLLIRDNFKKLVFWSRAGAETLRTYGGIEDEKLLRKVTVVYPSIRDVPDDLIRFDDRGASLLFSGDFFRKGGVNVVDAFERAQRTYPSIRLRLCCDEAIDFNTRDADLRAEYLGKIGRNDAITLGRIPRDELIRDILPTTDIFLSPTYVEAFGYAILEAMAFGIPVISTTHFAIPEMVEHGTSGFLIDTKPFDCERLFRGYVVNRIPREFSEYMTDHVFRFLSELLESAELRMRMGLAGLAIARTRFSPEERNSQMLEIYREALR
jgi:glycosyltransferase involved in cell wall biosynthesis